MGDPNDEAAEVEITPARIEELMLWHGTDESSLPPAHTLQHLSRDTIAALRQLARSRETIARLRAAMGRAFWAADRRELHAILLDALGPPPEPPSREDPAPPRDRPRGPSPERPVGRGTEAAPPRRLDPRGARGPRERGSGRSIRSRSP